MTDIVERLRQELAWIICSDERKLLLSDAKAEIERLRIAVRDQAGVELSEENDRLIAENERLHGIIEFMDAANKRSASR